MVIQLSAVLTLPSVPESTRLMIDKQITQIIANYD